MTLSYFAFTTIIDLGFGIAMLEQGTLAHAHMVKCCVCEEDMILSNNLIGVYRRCESINDA